MAYPLRTERLVIEPLGPADIEAFHTYRQDPDIARWQSWSPDYSMEEARRLVESQPTTALPSPGDWLQLAIHDRLDGSLRGDVALHALSDQPDTYEIGATIAAASQHQGYAIEAARSIVGCLLTEVGAHRVVAFCDSRNEPVARLLRRIGMRHESRQVCGDWFKGEWTTLDGYAILATEWPVHH
jgi:RimJ/RimL family protein N-acetyltransferase